jgi:hypothetical protein
MVGSLVLAADDEGNRQEPGRLYLSNRGFQVERSETGARCSRDSSSPRWIADGASYGQAGNEFRVLLPITFVRPARASSVIEIDGRPERRPL